MCPAAHTRSAADSVITFSLKKYHDCMGLKLKSYRLHLHDNPHGLRLRPREEVGSGEEEEDD